MRALKRFVFGALGCLCSLPAFAQDARGVDIQLFQPAVDSRGLLTKNRSETLGNGDVSFGMWINGARNPLVLNELEIAEAIVTANFYGSYGLFGFLEVGVGAPFNITNGPDVDPLGGATAPVLVPEVAEDDGRLVGIERVVDRRGAPVVGKDAHRVRADEDHESKDQQGHAGLPYS